MKKSIQIAAIFIILFSYKAYSYNNQTIDNYKELTHLAEQGDGEAQAALGYKYMDDKNSREAEKWLTKSLALKNPYAYGVSCSLIYASVMHKSIDISKKFSGINKVDKAVELCKEGASLGDEFSMQILTHFYKESIGVTENFILSYMWSITLKTSMNNHKQERFNFPSSKFSKEKFNKYITKLSENMSPEQISKAQEISKKCVESNYKNCDGKAWFEKLF